MATPKNGPERRSLWPEPEPAGRSTSRGADQREGGYAGKFRVYAKITRLDWSAIDLKEGILTIGAQIAKKRRLRVIELMPNCIAWLSTIKHWEGRVAPGKYTVRWAEFVKNAGCADWGENRSNAMRHSFGSYHYALGSDAAKTAAMTASRR